MADRRNRRDDRRERPQRRERSERPERQDRNDERTDMIIGRNPVIEALKNKREMEKIIIADGSEGSVSKIIGMAKDQGIVIQYRERSALDRMAGGRPHQGVVAFVSAYKYSELEDIFALAEKRNEQPFIMILDDLEDPHNLGAIMRTCDCAGAHGVIIPKRRAAGLTEIVGKASAGAVEYVPCVRVTNIAQTIDKLKDQGVWIAACDMGGTEYYRQNLTGSIGIVIGSEGKGISKLVKEKCDFTVSMPMMGRINSLNASNAAAVIMYEVRKQRDGQ